MRIYITGCARTGTTLVKNLMYAWKPNIAIHDQEEPIEWWAGASGNAVGPTVAKRHYGSIFSNVISENNSTKQREMIRKFDLKIINCVRQQKGVMKPGRGITVPASRWKHCMMQAEAYKNWIAYTISYEALCSDPYEMQCQLIEALGLSDDCARWDKFPIFVPDSAFAATNLKKFPGYGRRPIERHIGEGEKEISRE